MGRQTPEEEKWESTHTYTHQIFIKMTAPMGLGGAELIKRSKSLFICQISSTKTRIVFN